MRSNAASRSTGPMRISDDQLSGAGDVALLEARLQAHYGMQFALCVSNATTALLAIALALELAGDEFVTTPYTWGGTIAPWLILGNQPVFADIEGQTLGLDAESARGAITPGTAAILAVDVHGVPSDTASLRRLADHYGIPYIADAAQSLGAFRGGAPASSLADAVVVSFGPGKSSLLNSIEYEVGKRSLPLVPVYLSAGEVKSLNSVGKFLFNLLTKISSHPDIAGAGVQPPSEERCCENMPMAYSQFAKDLADKIPGRRVLALLDNFQSLIEAASDARDHNPSFTSGIAGLLNIIYANGNPRARILWVFAGHRTLTEYRSLLPGADLWGTLRELSIDFLDRQSVKEIITEPLRQSSLVVPEETVSLAYRQTAGHPEIVQKVAELMLFAAVREKRWILTPADVDAAVRNLALFTDDSFAIAWYPEGELSDDQAHLMVDLIKKAPVGGRIDPSKLVAPKALTDKDKAALDDLKARRILDESQDGTVGVRAYVLDLWLHKMLRDVRHREPDSPAIFVDVANLTAGRGSATLNNLQTTAGEGLAGCFALKTVLSSIEAYVYKLTPIPVAAQWVVNYPERCPAVMECNAKGYRIANIPEYLWKKSQVSKGADDTVLQETINEVQSQSPNVKHFILVTGDKDYRVKVENLLKSGKHVHIVSRAGALGNPDTKHSYDYLAKRYPERFTVKRLEELLEEEVRRPSSDRRGAANVL